MNKQQLRPTDTDISYMQLSNMSRADLLRSAQAVEDGFKSGAKVPYGQAIRSENEAFIGALDQYSGGDVQQIRDSAAAALAANSSAQGKWDKAGWAALAITLVAMPFVGSLAATGVVLASFVGFQAAGSKERQAEAKAKHAQNFMDRLDSWTEAKGQMSAPDAKVISAG